MKFRTLKPNEIDVRIGNVYPNKGITFLLYKDARVDMTILDEAVGPDCWQREHYEVKGNLFCRVGIYCQGEWVWKADCGTESYTEKEKGEASDSFKRACVNWGIGRELYTSPLIYIPLNADYFEGKRLSKSAQKQLGRVRVSEIEYNENREITNLVLIDAKGVVVWRSR